MVSAGSGSIGAFLGLLHLMVTVLVRGMLRADHRVMVRPRPGHHDRFRAVLTCRRTQHGSRYRTPNGEQDGKQHQQPDTNGSHS